MHRDCNQNLQRPSSNHQIGHLWIFAISVHLDGGEGRVVCNITEHVFVLIHKYSNPLNPARQVTRDLQCCVRADIPRAFFVEHESDGIGAGFGSNQCIFDVRDSADLDPSHRNRGWSSVLGRWQNQELKLMSFRAKKIIRKTNDVRSRGTCFCTRLSATLIRSRSRSLGFG